MNTKLGITAAALLLTSLAGPGMAESGSKSVQTDYAAAMADLRAAGIPTSTAEVYPESAPDDENAAPLYTKMSKDPEYAPTQGETDALPVLSAAPTVENWRAAEKFVADNSKLLALVHQAAGMPVCVVPGRGKMPEPSAILFPELVQSRRAERILAVESAVMAHNGQGAAAIDNAALGFKLANHGYQEPTLIGWLVGAAVDSVAINNIELIMTADRSDPAVLSEASLVLSAWTPHSLAVPLKGEAAMALTDLRALRSTSPLIADANAIPLARYFKAAVLAGDKPYPVASKEFANLEANLADQHGDDYSFAHEMFPVYSNAPARQATTEARIAIALGAAALFAYHIAHGEYPGKLSQAMTDTPVDPFDLQPLRYRPDGNGFVLYSVGESGAYAGGAHTVSETVMRVSGDGGVSWK